MLEARCVTAIVIGNGIGDQSSNPGWGWLRFTRCLGKAWIHLFSLQLWINSRIDYVIWPWFGNHSRRRKILNSCWRLVGWLVWFFGISTFVGHLMPSPFYTYKSKIWFLNTYFRYIFKWAWAHFFHTVKWFHLFLSNTNNSIYY